MRLKKLIPWLTGIVAASLLFGLLATYTPFHYLGSDDTPILRSFMGFEGSIPAHFNMLIHTFFAWMLHGLGLLIPGVAWFSILHLFLLWFSCVVIVKSGACCAVNHRHSVWAGAIAGTVFIFVYAAYISCRINFTTTGALVGAAAVAQLMGVDYQNGKNGPIIRGMVLSIVLLLCCYSMRQIGVLPPLAFWLLALALIWLLYFRKGGVQQKQSLPVADEATAETTAPASSLEATPSTFSRKRSAKPLLIGMLICALSFGLFAGVRAIEIKTLDLDGYLQWQNARSRLFDYTNFELDYAETDPAILEEIGWSQAELKLVANWFFIDHNVTTEAFEKLYNFHAPEAKSASEKLRAIPASIQGFLQGNPSWSDAFWLTVSLAALCAIALLLRKQPGRLWLFLGAICGLLLGALLLMYLVYEGRLPLRAWVSATLPAAAFFLCLPFACVEPITPSRDWRLLPITLLCTASLVLAGFSIAHTVQNLYYNPDPEEDARSTMSADLDEFALENEDILIIYDLSLTNDRRLFPETEEGVPGNVMFWGGYPARSPSWYQQLAAYDIDGHAFTAEDFLRDNVLVAGGDSHPWESLLAYIEEETGLDIEWDFYDEVGYVYFYDIYEY